MKREFIWDLDGTLLDTYPAMVAAMVQAVVDLGQQVTTTEAYQLMRQHSVGFTERTFAQRYGWDWQALRAKYQHYEPQLQVAPQPFPGAADVLAKVQAVGGHNYLMTHRNGLALTYLKQTGLYAYFDDFVTAAQPFPRKPNPAALNYLLDRHHVDRTQAVMVGDRNLDVEAGHRAQIAGYLFDVDELITVTSQPEAQVTTLTALLSLVG